MKIQNDATRALLAQDEPHRKPRAGAAGLSEPGGFEALLSGQMRQAGAAAAPDQSAAGQAATLALRLRPSELTGEIGATAGAPGDAPTPEALAETRLDGLLGQWEAYAAALSGGGDLRSVYGLLQNMTAEVNALKASVADFRADGSALEALVNELDVLTVTETVKFNRGDYL